RPLIAAWILVFPLILFLFQAFGGVAPLRWGGVMLNLLLAYVAVFLSFPVGVLLAFGRRSTLPVIRTFCVGMIEFIRGAPLVTWLLFSQFVLPLLIPQVGLPAFVRIAAAFTVFSSAYVAEIVRGGLQGVHEGQFEAARALGLSTLKMNRLIVLPQALRNTIPAMIGHFISLVKDTTLVGVIGGFIDVLRAARASAASLTFLGDIREALLAAAFLLWILTFSMSRWSQRLERRLGVGER
ncbi:MAG: amino acid ABC transporter permease, partial [Actinomycetota bacterium]|nr:amino acid ABC transporter permease [Actinomycetota bacterium]